jgi:hypothetical protein
VGAVQPAVGVVEQVDRAERHVERVGGQRAAEGGHHLVLVAEPPPGGGDGAEQLLAALGEHLPGDLGAHGVHPGDLTGVVEGGGVRDREVGLLAVPGALEQQRQPRQPGGLAGGHRVLHGALEGRPALGQGDPDVLADGGVLGADERGVAVVVELHVLRAPGEHHGEARGEHRADREAQAGRPRGHRSDRGGRPVQLRHQPAALTAAGEEGGVVRARR